MVQYVYVIHVYPLTLLSVLTNEVRGLSVYDWEIYTRTICAQNCYLDLDSSRIQLDTLGHTPTPSVSVKSCHLCFLPGEPHLS